MKKPQEVDPSIALVLEGPGFHDQSDVVKRLEYRKFKVRKRVVGFEKGYIDIPEFETAGFILMRGPWQDTPDDRIMAEILQERVHYSLEPLKSTGGFKAGQKVLAIGRGALLLLFSGMLGKAKTELKWREALRDAGPWLDTEWASGGQFKSLVLGRAVPANLPEVFDGFQPWLKVGSEVVGWKKGGVHIAMTDVLAFSERSQLPDYGYADLSMHQGQEEVLSGILSV